MRSVNNDWEMFIEHEAKLCRQEQEREKHGKYKSEEHTSELQSH